MKTSILILFLILCSSRGFTQVTLTAANNNPVSGDIDAYLICDTTNISQGNSGANQTWNYPNLIRQDSTAVNFVSAGSTPYASQFPNSNIASSNDNANYTYFAASSASLIVNGIGGPDIINVFSDPQLFLQYPFTYNSSFTDNFASTFILSGNTVVETGTTAVSGDAWGTLNLPNGTYPNALRVKYIINTRDSSNIGIPFITLTNTTSYVWFVPGRKFPVFEIVYTTITINGTQFGNNKTVNYNSSSTSGITSISSEIPESFTLSQNYPNPFNPSTNLEFGISKLGFVSLKIYDMLGKEVATLVSENLSAGIYKYNFDASGLTSGIYFYTLTAKGFSETKRMILLK